MKKWEHLKYFTVAFRGRVRLEIVHILYSGKNKFPSNENDYVMAI